MFNRILTAALLAWPLLSAAAPSTPSADVAQLLAAEDARFQAVLAHDTAALERGIADDVVYSHMTGQRDDKAAVLRSAARLSFSSIQPLERTARVIGEVGIVRGKLVRQLPDRTLTDGYLALFALRDGRWQLLEWVSAAPQAGEPAK